MYGIKLKGCIIRKAENHCVRGTSRDWSVSKVYLIYMRTSAQILISNKELGVVRYASCPRAEEAGPEGPKGYWPASLAGLVSPGSQLRDLISK